MDAIRRLTSSILTKNGGKALHVDWYGGEPLLNIDFLNAASSEIQAICVEFGASYRASIISNGSSWPDDVEAFVTQNKIIQAQISFDGLKARHDKSRRYRKSFDPDKSLSSFDRAVELVDKLVMVTRVDVRYNIDRKNVVDLFPFLDFAESRDWFRAPFPAVFQPARLAYYSEKTKFMRNFELGVEEFDELRENCKASVGRYSGR